jgi:hypothetical protein
MKTIEQTLELIKLNAYSGTSENIQAIINLVNEAQNLNVSQKQYLMSTNRVGNVNFPSIADGQNRNNFNNIFSESRVGAGLNYYLSDFNCNLKLQYEQIFYGRFTSNGQTETKSGGEIKLQLTCFLFQ